MTRLAGVVLATLAATGIGGVRSAATADSTVDKTVHEEMNYQRLALLWPYQEQAEMTLSPKNCREKFRLTWNGTIHCSEVIAGLPSQADLEEYSPYKMAVSFGAGNSPCFEDQDRNQVGQRLRKGYLPAVETTWRYGQLEYRQLAFARLFEAKSVTTGREKAVALVRLQVRNESDQATTGVLWVNLGTSKPCRWSDQIVYDDLGRIRMTIAAGPGVSITPDAGQVAEVTQPGDKTPDRNMSDWVELGNSGRNLIRCEMKLAARGECEVYLKLPYFPLPSNKSEALQGLDFQRSLYGLITNWERELTVGMKVQTPDPIVNEIYKALLVHLFSSAEINPDTGQWLFKMNPHQKHIICEHDDWSLVALDQRGYQKEAGRYLQGSYVDWQGQWKPPRFESAEGHLAGPPGLEGGPLTHKNGQTLWAICEHCRLSGNKEWTRRLIPNILASCDLIKRERAATKKMDTNGEKAINFGCLPAGMLSDWGGDTQFGVRSDAYGYLGLVSAAEVLAAAKHPRADEIAGEAADYRECIRDAVRRAIQRADKIRLPNGELIPYVPSELQELGPRHPPGKYSSEMDGWGLWTIDSDCGFLWVVECGVFDATEPEVTWHLRFLEEYPVHQKFPGFPYVAPLMLHSLTYRLPLYDPESEAFFWRDEMEKYVECFYSLLTFGLSRKTYVGLCHPMPVGGWDFPSTAGQVQRFLRRSLIQERGKELHLARGVPKAWLEDGKTIAVQDAATHFGPMGYEIRSHVADGAIEATVEPPRRNPPDGLVLKLRYRHPQDKPIKSVTVDGREWRDFATDTVSIVPNQKKRIEIIARF